MRRLGYWIGGLAMAVACVGPVRADEPLFGFINTTDLLPHGKTELEQWATLREGRANGPFHVLQTRSELSYGVTDAFQLSGYLNFAYANVDHNGPDGTTTPPEIFADYQANPDHAFKKGRFESGSVEAIYRVLSPYTDPVGLALYVEPSVGPRTREVEMRLILQKNFLEDRLVFAFNATLGYEWRFLHGDPDAEEGSTDFSNHWDKETDVNFGLAGSYRFAPKWSAGAELENEREWAGLNPFNQNRRTNVAWYLGPTLHYGGEHFFATFTTLFQLPVAQDYANSGDESAVIHGRSNADDFENMRFRVKVGYYFD